jgi:hypothetical protein
MTIGGEGAGRTGGERESQEALARLFEENPDSTTEKLASFSKYARRQDITAFLARYEVFKLALPVKGSIVECGVFRGAGLMTWAKLSSVLEPGNMMRRIYGFDTFDGFPTVGGKDQTRVRDTQEGELRSDSYGELLELIEAFDGDRFLGHVPKVQLVKGDGVETIPLFVEENPHLVVSLLFLDFDLYEPTRVALQHFLPRMPKGAVLAFDELDNPAWPGETLAMLDEVGAGRIQIRRHDFDPYIGFAVLD